MNKNQLKQYLLENVDKIELILEYIGCHDIKYIKDKRVQCGLPNGDNKSSVQIKLDEFLSAKIYTRNKFLDYEIRDIFTVVQFIKNIELNEAIQLICDVCKIKYSYESSKKNNSNSYNFLKMFKKNNKDNEIIEETTLPEWFSKRFIREDCLMYLKDGVDSNIQNKFGVSYDVLDNRVVFPIRNDEGKLLSFKGRTCDIDYKTKDIPKFISYYPCSNNNYLFGLYENYFDILEADEIIIVEAEKSVMQLATIGINNVVSINKKTISPIQLKKILKLGINNIVLALDNDVSMEEIEQICKQFKGLKNLFYLKDTSNLLNQKDSPSDKGEYVFKELYKNKIAYIRK